MTIARSVKMLFILLATAILLGAPGYPNRCIAQAAESDDPADTRVDPKIIYSGPRQNVPPGGPPKGSGLSTFTISVPNVISRSGQPTITGFKWLKEQGWKGVVDLRVSNDNDIPGFKELSFNYLALPITEGSVPSDNQAQEFLKFATDPLNHPLHIHCHGGIGRTGVMMALYRYAVQGWPVDKAIHESYLFSGGVNEKQKDWIERWAQAHKPGSHKK